MRLVDLICLSVIIALFSSAFSGFYSQMSRIDKKVAELRKRTDSMLFISKSFYNSCEGKGFASLDEWKKVCAEIWKLESIDWETIGGTKSGLYRGKWKGPYGSGEVYGKTQK